MKSSRGSRLSPTVETGLFKTVAVDSRPTLWGIAGYSDAPCRNRTYNLMIKSQLQASVFPSAIWLRAAFQAIQTAQLVPPEYPNEARSFPSKSHGGGA